MVIDFVVILCGILFDLVIIVSTLFQIGEFVAVELVCCLCDS